MRLGRGLKRLGAEEAFMGNVSLQIETTTKRMIYDLMICLFPENFGETTGLVICNLQFIL